MTAAERFEWLNRAQCIGVGRMDMSTLRLEFDVYVVRVENRAHRAANDSLYTRLAVRLNCGDHRRFR